MNVLPFAGYWFYGALSNDERAAFFSSWGLLGYAPSYIPPTGGLRSLIKFILYKKPKGDKI